MQAASALAAVNLLEQLSDAAALTAAPAVATGLHARLSGAATPAYVLAASADALAMLAKKLGSARGGVAIVRQLYPELMPIISNRLSSAVADRQADQRERCATALVTALGALAGAAGSAGADDADLTAAFARDAPGLVSGMVGLLSHEGLSGFGMRTAVHAALAKVAPLLGAGGFAGPLGALVPPLLASAEAEVEITFTEVEDRDDEGDGDTEVQYIERPDGKGFVQIIVNKSQMDEKLLALQVTTAISSSHHHVVISAR